jgi:hypothetical protein
MQKIGEVKSFVDGSYMKISRHIMPFLCGKELPVDFPVFNVRVPRNEDRSHRLNTSLRTMVEIAGDQPPRATNDKAVVRTNT